MTEEELLRIEQGDPQSPGEIVVGIMFGLGILGLLGYIVFVCW